MSIPLGLTVTAKINYKFCLWVKNVQKSWSIEGDKWKDKQPNNLLTLIVWTSEKSFEVWVKLDQVSKDSGGCSSRSSHPQKLEIYKDHTYKSRTSLLENPFSKNSKISVSVCVDAIITVKE